MSRLSGTKVEIVIIIGFDFFFQLSLQTEQVQYKIYQKQGLRYIVLIRMCGVTKMEQLSLAIISGFSEAHVTKPFDALKQCTLTAGFDYMIST